MDILSRTCLITIFTLTVTLTSLVQVKSQDCQLFHPNGDPIPAIEWQWGTVVANSVPDTTVPSTEFYYFTNEGFTDPQYTEYIDYFDVQLTENTISLRVSKGFPDIEAYLPAQKWQFYLPLSLKCGQETRVLNLGVTLIDSDNHYPNFTNTGDIIYYLPMPLPADVELTYCFHTDITAKDLDMSNSNIKFEVGNGGEEYFSITSVRAVQDYSGKSYNGILKTIKELRFEEKTTFTITSTDTGTPETKSDVRNLVIQPVFLESSTIKKPLHNEIIENRTDNLRAPREIDEGIEKEKVKTVYENDNSSDCQLFHPNGDPIPAIEWQWGTVVANSVPDTTVPGTEFYYFTNEGFTDPQYTEYSDYFDVQLTENTISLRVSKGFPDIEAYLPAQKWQFYLPLSLKCGQDTRLLNLGVTLIDSDNHYPNFTNTGDIIYYLPMPLPADVELTYCFHTDITAKDLDMSNSNIKFQVGDGGEEYFTITSVRAVQDYSGKSYNGILKTIKELRFEKKTTFTITSTDTGTPETKSDVRNLVIQPVFLDSSRTST